MDIKSNLHESSSKADFAGHTRTKGDASNNAHVKVKIKKMEKKIYRQYHTVYSEDKFVAFHSM